MGLVADNAQIGQSATAAQNFNIRAPLDGTLRLSRGNAGTPISDPIKIESNNDVTLLGNLLTGVIGAGQTWQDVTASKALTTVYTNTSGKPIVISVSVNSTSVAVLRATIGGVVLISPGQGTTGVNINITAIVPIGATYSVTLSAGSPSGFNWLELR